MNTLTNHLKQFLHSRVAVGVYTDHSSELIESRLRPLAESFGARPLAELRRPAVEEWLATLAHLAPNSRAAYLCSARQFCRWLVAADVIDADPTATIAPIRRPRTVPRAQSHNAIAACIAACRDDRERLIVLLEVEMGMRRGEVAAARWEHYDPSGQVLWVRGKGSHERDLPVPASVAELLNRRGHGPIIESHAQPGVPICAARVGQITAALMLRAGVKHHSYDGVSGHAFRHTCASDVLDRCHDLRVVQQMLGHADLSSTAIYLRRASLPAMRDAMEGRSYDVAA